MSLFPGLKPTLPRDSLAVITPGVEEHLAVAMEGEIQPIEHYFYVLIIILPHIRPDLAPPALDEVPHGPGLRLTEG